MVRALALLLAVAGVAHAEAPTDLPARVLPPPLGKGGSGGFVAPTVSTDDLAAHLRGTLQLGAVEGGPPAPLFLGWQLGASVSLWRWAEAGATFSGRWELGTRTHHPGPVELWLRAGPPDLRGLALQLLLEHASGRGGFDGGGTIWPSTTTLGAVAGWHKGRIELGASLAYQGAGEDLAQARYHGLQASGAAWLTAIRSGPFGLQLGGEVLTRAGGAEGLRGALDVGWTFAAGVRLIDEHGAAFAAGYGQGQGPGLAPRAGYLRMGYSWGRGYVPPPPDPTVPPLFDGLEDWLRQAWLNRNRPPAAAPLLPPPGLLQPAAPPGWRLPPPRQPPPPLPWFCRSPLRLAAQALRSCTTAWDLGQELALGPERPELPGPVRGPGGIAGGGPPRTQRASAPRGPLRTGRGGTGYTDPDTRAAAPGDLPAAIWNGGRPGGPVVVPGDAPTPPPSIPIRPQPPGPLPVGVRPEQVPPFLRPPAPLPSRPVASHELAPMAPVEPRPTVPPRPQEQAPQQPSSTAAPGPYDHLPEPPNVGRGLRFTRAQLEQAKEENAKQNGGQMKDDYTKTPMLPSTQSRSGVTPDPREVVGDHRIPRKLGGTNSNSNLRLTTREYNAKKGARPPTEKEK